MKDPKILESHEVPAGAEKQRLSDYLVGIFTHLPSRKSVKKAIDKSRVLVNGEKATTGLWVQPGMRIELIPPSERPAYELAIEIVYEDQHLAIVNKPPGLPTSGNAFKTLENTLPFNIKVADGFRPQPVHRLDRATGGLLIVAKSAEARIKLGKMLESRKIKKVYQAIVKGLVDAPSVINQPIDGKTATTEILEALPTNNEQLSLLKLAPHTGRTHQLRIHCSQAGFGIVGDNLYGDYSIGKGLLLCATQLNFDHPIDNNPLEICIPLPRKFQKLLP